MKGHLKGLKETNKILLASTMSSVLEKKINIIIIKEEVISSNTIIEVEVIIINVAATISETTIEIMGGMDNTTNHSRILIRVNLNSITKQES
jgi:hypothetical protein